MRASVVYTVAVLWLAGSRRIGVRGIREGLPVRSLFRPAFALLFAALAACSSAQARVEPGTRTDLPAQGPEPGALEAQALGYLEQMTAILTSPSPTPQEAVMSLGRYLDANRDEIRRVVREIEARVAAMTTPERLYYEERFSEYFAPANQRWIEALNAFRNANPAAGVRVDGLMIYFD